MLGMVDFTWQTVNIDDSGCVPAGAHKRIIQDKHECKREPQGYPYTKTNIEKCTKQIFMLYMKFGLMPYVKSSETPWKLFNERLMIEIKRSTKKLSQTFIK